MIEKEALDLIWVLKHFDIYVGSGIVPVVIFPQIDSPVTRLLKDSGM